MTKTWVLLHGFTGSPAVFDGLVGQLEGRVLRPLLPGHGPSPASVQSWAAEVQRLADALDREGVRGAELIGYSFGGRLGRHLLDRDDLFARATLIGAHPGLETEAETEARRVSDAQWIHRLETDGLAGFIEAWESMPFFKSQQKLSTSTLARQRAIRSSNTAEGLADALLKLGLAEMPLRTHTPPKVSVRQVVGELDQRHRDLAEKLDLPLSVVRGCGHNVVLEAPDALLELLR